MNNTIIFKNIFNIMQITKINSALYFIVNSHFTFSTVIDNNYNFG